MLRDHRQLSDLLDFAGTDTLDRVIKMQCNRIRGDKTGSVCSHAAAIKLVAQYREFQDRYFK